MSDKETMEELEARLETMSVDSFPIETGLSPPITPLTDNSFSTFLQSHNYQLQLVTKYCLACTEKLTCNIETHIFIAEHTNPIGVYCRFCKYFLITEEQIGFKNHLLSSFHRTATKRAKINRRKSRSETRQRLVRENNERHKHSSKTRPITHTKCREQTEGKPELSYIINGFSPEIEFPEFFDLCTKFGSIKMIAVNFKKMEAHVTFYKFNNRLLEPKLLGNHTTFQSVDQFRRRQEKAEWIQWDDSVNLTPCSQNIMCSLKNINDMVSNALKQSEELKNYCHSKIKLLKAQLIHLLDPEFSINYFLFYGATINGLTPRNEGLFTFLDYCPKNGNSTVDLVTYLTETLSNRSKNFSIHLNNEGYPVIVHKSLNMSCILTIGDSVSYMSDSYIKLYRSMDTRVTWLILAFREWWSMNMSSIYISTKNSPVEWMVIFFLMQPDIEVVPPFQRVLELCNINISTDTKGKAIYELGKQLRSQHKQKCKRNNALLLIELFIFYSKLNYTNTVLSPLTGDIINRSIFKMKHLSSIKNSKAANSVLENSHIIFLNPLEPSCNLLQEFDSESVKVFINKINMSLKCMM